MKRPHLPSRRRVAHRRHGQRAFTLMEVVVSVVIAGLLLATMTSAIVLATKALPTDASAAVATTQSADALQQLRDDLRAAVHLTRRAPTSVTLVVADRDADGLPEVITYAWDGANGDPLTRAVNGGTAVTVLDNLADFGLTYDTVDSVQGYPGGQSQSAEVELSKYDPAASQADQFTLDGSNQFGFFFTPNLPADAGSTWQLTRLVIRPQKDGPANGTAQFDFTRWTGNAPDATPLASFLVGEADMFYDYLWTSYTMPQPVTYQNGDTAAIVFKDVGSGVAGRIQWDSQGAPASQFETGDGGATWDVASGQGAVEHYVYGTYAMGGDDWALTRQRVTAVGVTLTHPAAAGPYTARVNLPNNPLAADALWEADFNADPTLLNLDGLSHNDWADPGNFDVARLADGRWALTETLRALPVTETLSTPTTIDLWLEDTTDDGHGGGLALCFDRSAGVRGRVTLHVQRIGSTQRVTVTAKTGTNTDETWLTHDVAAGENVHLHAAIDPTQDVVAVAINGVHRGGFNYARGTDPAMPATHTIADSADPGVFVDRIRVQTGGIIEYAEPGTLASIGQDLSLSLSIGGLSLNADLGDLLSGLTGSTSSSSTSGNGNGNGNGNGGILSDLLGL